MNKDGFSGRISAAARSFSMTRPLAALAVLTVGLMLEACGPSDHTETVAFVLDLHAERVKSIDFRVNTSSGNFTKDDGGCDPSNAVTNSSSSPGSVSQITITPPAVDAVSSSSSTTTSTDEPTTTTVPTSTSSTSSTTTTTIRITDNEFESHSDGGQLSIHAANPNGIAPGSAIAFCRFQGDASSTDFDITTTSCALASGAACNPTTQATVLVSTTTTTTTTTTTVTLLDDGESCDTSADCDSGFCVDDVCCGTACVGTCVACSADLTNGNDGTCTNIPFGEDPDDECINACSGAGSCN